MSWKMNVPCEGLLECRQALRGCLWRLLRCTPRHLAGVLSVSFPCLLATDVSSAYAVSLETVLAGHENWVYGVHWQPPVTKGRLSYIKIWLSHRYLLYLQVQVSI